MPERKRERSRRQVDNPLEPHTVETKKGKQTKFVLDLGDIAATPEQIEDLRSGLLKNSIALLKSAKLATVAGQDIRPKIGVEAFSVSFSVSFSLGA
jgi:hypothetical protein